MSTAVKPNTERSGSAFVVSMLLHASMLLSPVLSALSGPTSRVVRELPNSVAMMGNSIEVEAPTTELAATPADGAPAPGPELESKPVDVQALPPEAAPAPVMEAAPAPVMEAAPAPVTEAAPAPVAKPSPTEVIEKTAVAARPVPPRPVPPRPVPPRVTSRPEDPVVATGPAKPRATPKPANAARTGESRGAATGAGAPTTATPAAGTFGQEGLAPGVRRLGYAFTRAIPAATPADAEWRELPIGKVGTIRIELEVDENNRLGAMKQWQGRAGEPAPPAVLQRMVERTLLLLRAGQFALSGSNQPGKERLVIDVTLRDEAAEGEGESVVVQKGFDGASPGRPGRAHFRYGNGRAFEAKVTIVPAAPR